MDAFLTADGLIALATLTFLEVVLGVDNVIFISILVGKLPAAQQPRAVRWSRGARWHAICCAIAHRLSSTHPLFHAFGHAFGARPHPHTGPVLCIRHGRIHEKLEGEEGHGSTKLAPSFGAVMPYIVLDIIFSSTRSSPPSAWPMISPSWSPPSSSPSPS